MLQIRVLGNQIKLSHNFDAIFCSIFINKYQFAPSLAFNMTTITNFAQNSCEDSQKAKPQLLFEIKIQEQQPKNKILFHDVSGFEVLNVRTDEKERARKEQTLVQLIPRPISSFEPAQKSVITHNQFSKMGNQKVEEKDPNMNKNFQNQFKQFSSSNWFLPRHPNSLFKVIPIKQKAQRKKHQNKKLPKIHSPACKSDQLNGQVQPKSTQVKCQDEAKNAKIQSKTKKIHKNPNFKPRKGKNQQPLAQKLIKKLSCFHYNKNYKQNRNKTLKKLAKRGLTINLQNFTEYIGKLKLQINKKFTKPDMKIKTNAKGEQVNPKKFYESYHIHFPLPKQREFVERFYNEVFKRVYVIMWKSDERLKRIDSIKIEGVHYDTVETDPSSDVKIQHKEIESQKQLISDSKAEDKRAAFVQCLDDEGKMELDQVFDEEYNKLYEGFDWVTVGEDLSLPEKDSLKNRIQKFFWIQD